jgi:hypothetical protein
VADKFAGSEFERRSECDYGPVGAKGRMPGVTRSTGAPTTLFNKVQDNQIFGEMAEWLKALPC